MSKVPERGVPRPYRLNCSVFVGRNRGAADDFGRLSPVALLELLAAPARAGVVAADLVPVGRHPLTRRHRGCCAGPGARGHGRPSPHPGTAVPGIVFLSGGQSAETATAHLNAMNALGEQPWQLSFSFARALQGPALETWRGDEGNLQQAQEIFAHRARMNGAARSGSYSEEMERELAIA